MSRRLSQQPDRRKERGGERPELLAQRLPDPAGGKYSGVADEEVALDEKQRAGVLHDAGTAGHDIADPHRDEEVDVHLDCRLGSILVAHPTVHAEEPVGERHQHSAMHDAAEVGMFLRRLKGERHTLLVDRSEEHTSELQSLMRISYAVFCLKTKKKNTQHRINILQI